MGDRVYILELLGCSCIACSNYMSCVLAGTGVAPVNYSDCNIGRRLRFIHKGDAVNEARVLCRNGLGCIATYWDTAETVCLGYIDTQTGAEYSI